ncbi:MAG: hypothetical protein ACD_76C00106G0032 [uncultured bacterium]|nr:MAG: hypothetical protein ACD_76C00106G0032 [uncultured bacterium]
MEFRNRAVAGKLLAEKLSKYANDKSVIVLALPRGGIIIANEIAKTLNCELDLVITRKIGAPDNPEFAVCVVDEQGNETCNEMERKRINSEWFMQAKKNEMTEAKRRREIYRSGRKELNLEGKKVILADDGIATGLTMLGAIEQVRAQKPNKIIVAVPVSPDDSAKRIDSIVDEFVFLKKDLEFKSSVGSYYDEFPQVSDDEVIKIMKNSI